MSKAKPSDHKGTAKYQVGKPQRAPKPENQDDRRRKASEPVMARRKGKEKHG